MMKAYLFLLCFIGVVPSIPSLLRPVAHKYYLIRTQMTWPDAQNYCRETYDDLATIENELDWIRLKAEVIREGLTDVAWIGLYNDIDSWRWSSNDLPLKTTFHQWNTGGGQPDNSGGHQSCCATGPYGHWWDDPCTDLFPFICYNADSTNAARYIGVDSRLSWHAAQAYCREFHTDLALITSTTENSEMQKIAYA
ncbi:lithostathine-1-beta-like [Neoarius graeffei]|uniref:lithostathine-1-beta-like n=1 Tax=Neoarius graeffei TaxID=443677 RepID=UPI00298C9203|nr:lithostathine-1-beta-like [Neoarius graeffei]